MIILVINFMLYKIKLFHVEQSNFKLLRNYKFKFFLLINGTKYNLKKHEINIIMINIIMLYLYKNII